MTEPVVSLQSASEFWTAFNLEGQRVTYDEVGEQLRQNQEQSVQRRRSLAEATQTFRRNAEAHVVTSVGSLLKQYQQEIDKLTTRAKFGERSFLDVCRALCEAPDPSPMLTSAVEMTARVGELEDKIRKQAQELAEYSAESEEIKNQDATIRRLEEKIRSLEQQVQSKQASQEQLKQEIENQLQEEAKGREEALRKMAEEANDRFEALQRVHQNAQDKLLLMQSKNEALKAQHTTEMEMTAAEVETARSRIMALETEKQKLTSKIEAASIESPSPKAGDDESLQQLQSQLEQQQKTIESTREEMEELQRTRAEFESRTATEMQNLEKAVEEKDDRVQSLERELNDRPTHQAMEELKRQLAVLQAVEYNADPTGEVLPASANSVESLLLKKNRHLEHQLTAEKLKQAEAQQKLVDNQGLLSTAQTQLAHQKELVAKLEEDLLTAQTSSGTRAASIGSEMDEAGQEGGQTTMLTVLRNQRDRFRDRARQLEAKLGESEREGKALRSKADAVSADNVALIERLRFLQGYRKEHAVQLDMESGLAAEQKYAKEYEDRMNPFREFQGRQRERRRRQMGLLDRTVFEVGDLVFGNKYARLFVCVYLMLLHGLVMLTLLAHHNRSSDPLASDVDQFCEQHGFSKIH